MIKVKGTAQIDKFSQELNLMINDINTIDPKTRAPKEKES